MGADRRRTPCRRVCGEAALSRGFREDRFEGVERVLREELGILAAVWLAWETDANDVDLHLWDARGGHADYGSRELRSGGELFADLTDGYGPECFAILGPASAAPYRVEAHYFDREAMGFGLGTLHVVEHDGAGGLRTDHRPFANMVDDGWIELGTWPPEH